MLEFLGSLIAALLSWYRGRDRQREEDRHEVAIARKQIEIVADRDRPDAADSLRRHDF